MFQLGYDDEAIWYMKDHEISEGEIAIVANAFRSSRAANAAFLARVFIFPTIKALRNIKFPGRDIAIKAAKSVPWLNSIIRNLSYKK